MKPEPDEKVRAEPDCFPADVKQEEIAGKYKGQHGERKKIEIDKISSISGVFGHVSSGIHVNEKCDTRNNQRHEDRERVDEKHSFYSKAPGKKPRENVPLKVP